MPRAATWQLVEAISIKLSDEARKSDWFIEI